MDANLSKSLMVWPAAMIVSGGGGYPGPLPVAIPFAAIVVPLVGLAFIVWQEERNSSNIDLIVAPVT